MRFTLEIDCDNDAFAEDPIPEITRILGVVKEKFESRDNSDWIRDINGNIVGSVKLID